MDRELALFILQIWMIFCTALLLIVLWKIKNHWNYIIKTAEEEFLILSKTLKQFKKSDKWKELANELEGA